MSCGDALLTASVLREELDIFAKGTLHKQLEHMKSSIVVELSGRTEVAKSRQQAGTLAASDIHSEAGTEEMLKRELWQLKASISAELAESRASIVREMKDGRQANGATQSDPSSEALFSPFSPVASATFPSPDDRRARMAETRQSSKASTRRTTKDFEKQGSDKQPLLDADSARGDDTQAVAGGAMGHTTMLERVTCLVNGPAFELTAATIVFMSVVWLTIQTHYNAVNWLEEAPKDFVWVEVVFCVLFSIELCLRLMVVGLRGFFCGSQRGGNIFDFTLVAFQLVDTSIEFFGVPGKRMTFSPFIRILRLFRIIRLVRIFRFFPELRMLLVSVFQSFQQLMWVFALIFFITAVFGLIITVIVNEYKTQFTEEDFFKGEDLGDDQILKLLRHNMQDFFGSVDRSILTLYGAISGGRDWHTSAAPLLAFVHPQLIHVFVLYTFFVIFAMMNVVTSQFVDSALEASANDRRESLVNNLMETFANSSGMISEEDFMQHLEDPSMKSFLKNLYKREDVSEEEIRDSRLFEMLDDDGGGTISKEELVLGCIRLTGSATSLDLSVMKLYVRNIRDTVDKIAHTMGHLGP